MKTLILTHATRLARQAGLNAVTRDAVAKAAGASAGLVNYHYKTMQALRDAVVAEAVEKKDLGLIAQAMALGHKGVDNATDALKRRAARTLF